MSESEPKCMGGLHAAEPAIGQGRRARQRGGGGADIGYIDAPSYQVDGQGRHDELGAGNTRQASITGGAKAVINSPQPAKAIDLVI